ncbi:monocyte to macrophage differentiation factor 2 isoform X1 [Octopus bimaculoides]|uniref:Monocyte to macrophage differentiation factor 2 n=2 Tax=Octopus bimaculoides TaxID=37653 RepID=A0A0L8HUM0_OCTBM|nr:monocyte to macrophage differentiation factor 2 isoform X1 [Octopus bimaculoides]|eukprot:XP_014769255.1 PREDICTED: monocyte to macrophage differentiation factor 2-like isoform X1 [Octopus bimaculoides]
MIKNVSQVPCLGVSSTEICRGTGCYFHRDHLEQRMSLTDAFVHIFDRLMNNRAGPGQAYIPTDVEHLANMVTHGLWILPSFGGLLWLLYWSVNDHQFLSACVFGLALFALFTTSTIYHALSYSGKLKTLKNVFHIGDRAAIYIFIAASYTPWLLLKDMENWGVQVRWLIWMLAMMGISYQYMFHEKYKWLETLLYVIIGVGPSITVLAMKETSGLYELTLGGITYATGVVFFKCDGIIPFAHAIWHCFVFVGATFHFYAISTYLMGHDVHKQMPIVTDTF